MMVLVVVGQACRKLFSLPLPIQSPASASPDKYTRKKVLCYFAPGQLTGNVENMRAEQWWFCFLSSSNSSSGSGGVRAQIAKILL